MSDPDDAIQWALPAISLGYAVQNDPDGKLKFWTDYVTIVHRCNVGWIASDPHSIDRRYDDLLTALKMEIVDGG